MEFEEIDLTKEWLIDNHLGGINSREIFYNLTRGLLTPDQGCWNKEYPGKKPLGSRFRIVGDGQSFFGLLRHIGQGTFGKVYKGFKITDKTSNSLVAIKTPNNDYLLQHAYAKGFIHHQNVPSKTKRQAIERAKLDVGKMISNEAVLTARLYGHPNVVSILSHDISYPYLILEYCNEGSLESKIRSSDYTSRDVIKWGFEIASALSVAHQFTPDRLVHRDLKPENILIHDGIAKISDFGASHMVEMDCSMHSIHLGFTPTYASPEIVADGQVLPASDVWSFGVILYKMISGLFPFNPKSLMQLAIKIVNEKHVALNEVNRLSMHSGIVEVVERCLEKDPNKRPSAEECKAVFNGLCKENQPTQNMESLVRDLHSTDSEVKNLAKNKLTKMGTKAIVSFINTVSEMEDSNKAKYVLSTALDPKFIMDNAATRYTETLIAKEETEQIVISEKPKPIFPDFVLPAKKGKESEKPKQRRRLSKKGKKSEKSKSKSKPQKHRLSANSKGESEDEKK